MGRIRLRAVIRVLYGAIDHLARDDGWAMASHLALSALMAIFPFFIFVAALAGLIGHEDLATIATDRVFSVWPPEIARPIADEIHSVLTVPRGGILTVSILVTIYLASNGVEAVRIALDRAYRCRDPRSTLFRRTQSVFFVLIGAVLSLAVAVFWLLGPLAWDMLERYVKEMAPLRSSFDAWRYGLLPALLAASLMAAHLWLPARQPPVRHVWPGVAMTLVLWWVLTLAFTTYLQNLANYVSTYAGLAGVVAAIFYLYLIGLILLFGAELNAAIAKEAGEALEGEKEVTPPEVTLPMVKRRFPRFRRMRRRSRPGV